MDVALPVTESSRICLPVPAGCSGLAHRNPHGLGSLSFRSWFSKDSILVRIGKPSPDCMCNCTYSNVTPKSRTAAPPAVVFLGRRP